MVGVGLGWAKCQMLVTLRPVRDAGAAADQVVDIHEPAGDQRGVTGVGGVAVVGRGVQCDGGRGGDVGVGRACWCRCPRPGCR